MQRLPWATEKTLGGLRHRGWDSPNLEAASPDLEAPRGSGRREARSCLWAPGMQWNLRHSSLASTGLPGSPAEAQTKLGARREGEGRELLSSGSPLLGHRVPPRCSAPPQTHVRPSPPLVTPALTHINPISHTPHKRAAEHTRSHPDKDPRSPKRPRLSIRGLFPVPQGLAWRLRRGTRSLGYTGLFAAVNPL